MQWRPRAPPRASRCSRRRTRCCAQHSVPSAPRPNGPGPVRPGPIHAGPATRLRPTGQSRRGGGPAASRTGNDQHAFGGSTRSSCTARLIRESAGRSHRTRAGGRPRGTAARVAIGGSGGPIEIAEGEPGGGKERFKNTRPVQSQGRPARLPCTARGEGRRGQHPRILKACDLCRRTACSSPDRMSGAQECAFSGHERVVVATARFPPMSEQATHLQKTCSACDVESKSAVLHHGRLERRLLARC